MNTKDPSGSIASPPKAAGSLAFDPTKYLGHIEEFEMNAAQKAEFLRTLWDIMATFVRLGFDGESVLPSLFQKASENATDALEQNIPTHEFNVAAETADRKEEA